jgi:hypothetical protein
VAEDGTWLLAWDLVLTGTKFDFRSISDIITSWCSRWSDGSAVSKTCQHMVVAISVARNTWSIPWCFTLIMPWKNPVRGVDLRDANDGCEVLTMTSRLSERSDLLNNVTRSPNQRSIDSWVDCRVTENCFNTFTRDLLAEIEGAGARKREATLQKECSVWHGRADALR